MSKKQKKHQTRKKKKNFQVLPDKKKESISLNKRYETKTEKEEQPKDKIIKTDGKKQEEEPESTKSIPANEICSEFRKYIKIFINLI